MDFHTLSRKDLQALCKKNRIPANITNVAMANALQALQMIEGIEELQEALKFQSPKTNQRTVSHKPVGPAEDQASPLPRSRRVTARAPGVLNLVDEEEKKKDEAETPKVPNTRRRASQKDESNEIVETMRASTRALAVRGVETQKEEKLVGLTTGRRTRGTVKKEVDLMSGGVRRSSRARGIAMASLAKEEVEGEKETGEVVVETTEEKVDDKAGEQEEEKVDDKAEKVDEVDDKAEEQEKVDYKAEEQVEEKVDDKAEQVEEKGAGDIVGQQNGHCYEKVAVETKNEEIFDDVAEQVEEKETNDIMEGEIKSLDQTYCHDLIMSEEGDFVDQMSDLQSEKMVVETSEEDKLDDKAEQEEQEEEKRDVQVEHEEVEIDDQADKKLDDNVEQEEEKLDVQVDLEEEEIDDQADEKLDDNVEQEEEKLDVQVEREQEEIDDQAEEKLEDKPEQEEEQVDQTEQEEEREMKGTVEEEIKSLEENTCNDLVMAVDEESVYQKNDFKYEEMAVIQEEKLDDTTEQEEQEEEEIDDQADEKLDDTVEQEEEKIDDQAEEKLEDKPEQEEEQIDDQTEQEEEREMKGTVEGEIKSLEENTCNDLIMAVDEESVDQKNDFKYEEMAAVKVIQEEKLDDKPEQEEEQTDDQAEQEMDDVVKEEIDSLENNTDIIFSHVEEREECSEFVEEAAIIIRSLITGQTSSNEEQQNPVAEEGKENETATTDESPIVEESGKETGDIKIGELIDNLSDLNLSSKEEVKADDGVLREENNNKENTEVVKSKTEKNYENMSLRKLKAAYKEVVVAMNKGEEKRAALKVIDENCI